MGSFLRPSTTKIVARASVGHLFRREVIPQRAAFSKSIKSNKLYLYRSGALATSGRATPLSGLFRQGISCQRSFLPHATTMQSSISTSALDNPLLTVCCSDLWNLFFVTLLENT